MIKYVFELRKDKVTQDGLMPIRILFRIGSSVIKRNTGLNCKPEDWQNNRVKANTKKKNITDMILLMKNFRRLNLKFKTFHFFQG